MTDGVGITRRLATWALVGVVGLASVGGLTAAVLDIYSTPSAEEFARNYERWLAMSDEQRAEIQQRWETWTGLDEDQRRQLKTRMQTLRRIRWRQDTADAEPVLREGGRTRERGRVVDVERSRVALERELRKLRAVAETRMRRTDVDDAAARKLFQAETRTSIDAFLDDLVGLDSLSEREREGLAKLETRELVERALVLAKTQHVAQAEAAAGDDTVATLEVLEPLEVMHRVDVKRAERGFTGLAGRRLHAMLDAEQRDALGRAYADEQRRRVRDIVLPHVATILEEQGVPEVDRVRYLAMPFNKLERHLNALMVKGLKRHPARKRPPGRSTRGGGEEDGPSGAGGEAADGDDGAEGDASETGAAVRMPEVRGDGDDATEGSTPGEPDGAEPDGAEPDGAEPDGAEPDGAENGDGGRDGEDGVQDARGARGAQPQDGADDVEESGPRVDARRTRVDRRRKGR